VCRGDWISIPISFPYPQKTCGNPHRIPTGLPIEPRNPPYLYPTPCVISLHAYLCCLSCVLYEHRKAIFMLYTLRCYCVYSDVCSVMIMKNNANYKLDCIWRNSNSDDDIRPNRVFSAFSLNLTSIRKSPYRIPAGPWRFITVPIPMGIRIPTAAGFYDVRLLLSCSWPTQLSGF